MNNPFKRHDPQGSFLPEEYVARKTGARANLFAAVVFSLVLLCLVAAFVITNRRWYEIREQERKINAEYTDEALKIEQLRTLEQQRDDMMDKAAVVTALIEKVPRSVLLADLVTRMPDNVSLLELQLASKRLTQPSVNAALPAGQPSKIASLSKGAKGKTDKGAKPEEAPKVRIAPPRFEQVLTIVGVAETNTQITDYLSAIQQSELLQSIELQYIKETVIDDSGLRKFAISAVVRPDADARLVEGAQEITLQTEPAQDVSLINIRGSEGPAPAPPAQTADAQTKEAP